MHVGRRLVHDRRYRLQPKAKLSVVRPYQTDNDEIVYCCRQKQKVYNALGVARGLFECTF